ncbi:MAG: PAS domain S-box protein [Acidobacteriota bacterium]
MSAGDDLFEALFQAAVEAVIVIDGVGRMKAFNPAAEKLFGYRASQVLGENVSLLMPEPMSSEHDGYLSAYRETGDAKIIGIGREVLCRKSSGALFPADLAVGEGRTGKDRFFVGVLRDLSERKRLQESLAAREAELRLILENSPVATAVLDGEGRILDVNPTWTQQIGPSTEGLSTLEDALAANERSKLAKAVGAATRGVAYSARHRIVGGESTSRIGTLLLAKLPEHEDDRVRLLCQFVDETAQINTERQLRQDREVLAEVSRLSVLGEMAAGIAHEVNQPLGAISNYAEAVRIKLGEGGDDKLRELLSKISSQAQRAGQVIQRLRSVAGSHQLEQASTFELRTLIHDVIELAALDARFVNVAVVTDFPGNEIFAIADIVAMQQVLLNLLRNAVEATAQAGGERVTVRASKSDGRARIAVCDEGTGIAEEHFEQIMQPFFTTKASGMGVGLALSQNLVEANRGRLWFENNEDCGATFYVELPLTSEGVEHDV